MGWLPPCLCDTRAHKRNNGRWEQQETRKRCARWSWVGVDHYTAPHLGDYTQCSFGFWSTQWLQAPVTAYTDPPRPRPTYTNLARAREISTDYAQLLGPYTQAESRKGRNAVRETHAAPLSTEGNIDGNPTVFQLQNNQSWNKSEEMRGDKMCSERK
ncbi:hypothetical protein B0H13DRAFT_1904806 [Mycena leptocephala]|nr:hypothetical protein B0H13DRAFT_1904806 [Mycena leptocephala]